MPAFALLGGVAIYLLGPRRLPLAQRPPLQHASGLIAALVLLALLPLAVEIPALATLIVVTALLTALIVYETVRFAELRERLRHRDPRGR